MELKVAILLEDEEPLGFHSSMFIVLCLPSVSTINISDAKYIFGANVISSRVVPSRYWLPPTLVIKLFPKDHIFTFLTYSQQ